ncbi:putative proline-rich receptor-like protein kinase PERK13 [Iris pallida]|uniref:Proline-rich receptor-like protein kinase PERK13 n=1 Tax=Iris pallida TaxID=29817 RepID=A0AAX6IJP3_IRIPA|nr:putative proline-rich receptor-like protein kinase PERK13 [Iris pallida]
MIRIRKVLASWTRRHGNGNGSVVVRPGGNIGVDAGGDAFWLVVVVNTVVQGGAMAMLGIGGTRCRVFVEQEIGCFPYIFKS